MLKIKKRSLPPGWYPATKIDTLAEIAAFEELNSAYLSKAGPGIGGILPHAGWFFSGDIAALVMASLKKAEPELVIVFGGHLLEGETPLITLASEWETPLGNIKLASDFCLKIKDELGLNEDIYPDNTVEIQLPLLKYYFPDALLIALRLPASLKAVTLAHHLIKEMKKTYKKFIILASTDLTHYGPNYDFIPRGTGQKALEWVKNNNDKGFIDLACALRTKELIKYSNKNGSSCSAGAVAGLMAIAQAEGVKKGELLRYKTSLDVTKDGSLSFVGYGGIVY